MKPIPSRAGRPARSTGSRWGFPLGLLVGCALAAAGSTVAQTGDPAGHVHATVLYAVSALAVDTEKNAQALARLDERLDDLEAQVSELLRAKR